MAVSEFFAPANFPPQIQQGVAVHYVRNRMGMTRFGFRLLRLANDEGLIFDLAHMSERAQWETLWALDRARVPPAYFSIVASRRRETDPAVHVRAGHD